MPTTWSLYVVAPRFAVHTRRRRLRSTAAGTRSRTVRLQPSVSWYGYSALHKGRKEQIRTSGKEQHTEPSEKQIVGSLVRLLRLYLQALRPRRL